jgi:hypothetical protein
LRWISLAIQRPIKEDEFQVDFPSEAEISCDCLDRIFESESATAMFMLDLCSLTFSGTFKTNDLMFERATRMSAVDRNELGL